MKSTGLFGKNSGRVGGVVYSSYKGIQVVKAYQPNVSNPSTQKQVAQRAKFKLATQMAKALGRELPLSYKVSKSGVSARNEWVKDVLKDISYSQMTASYPIEDIVLTKHQFGTFIAIQENPSVSAPIELSLYGGQSVTLSNLNTLNGRAVLLAYAEGGELKHMGSYEFVMTQDDSGSSNYSGNIQPSQIFPFLQDPERLAGYSNFRLLLYVYDIDSADASTYEDYSVVSADAELDAIRKIYAGGLMFTETVNLPLRFNV